MRHSFIWEIRYTYNNCTINMQYALFNAASITESWGQRSNKSSLNVSTCTCVTDLYLVLIVLNALLSVIDNFGPGNTDRLQ